MPLPGNKSIFT